MPEAWNPKYAGDISIPKSQVTFWNQPEASLKLTKDTKGRHDYKIL